MADIGLSFAKFVVFIFNVIFSVSSMRIEQMQKIKLF